MIKVENGYAYIALDNAVKYTMAHPMRVNAKTMAFIPETHSDPWSDEVVVMQKN